MYEYEKIFRYFVVLVLILSFAVMFSTSAIASSGKIEEKVALPSEIKIEQDIVNEYLSDLGYKNVPNDTIVMMDSQSVLNGPVSNWDLVVQYVVTGKCPEGIEIKFEDGSIEIVKDKQQMDIQDKNPISIKSTYTVFQKSYNNVVSHLNIGSGYLSAFTGHYYWIIKYQTDADGANISVSVDSPTTDVYKSYFDGSKNSIVTHSGSVCNNPPSGDWFMAIYGRATYMYGALMREN